MGCSLHTVLVRRRAPPPSLVCALLRHAGVGSPCVRDPRGSGWGRWGARCAGPVESPPPRVAVPSGGRGAPPRAPPALVRAPVFPGPASDRAAPFAPSWAPPVRRRPAAGRACGRLPRPWCPSTPGAAASSRGVRGRLFFGLPPSALGPEWEGGGGGGGGPLVPWRRLLTAEGGGGFAVPAPGASHRLGGRTLPPPPST